MRAWTVRAVGVAIALVVSAPVAGRASALAVAADVRIPNGMGVLLEATEGAGNAWLQTLYGTVRHVAIDCAEVREYPNPHHYFTWPPFHVLLASGVGEDGTRYYITAYDYGVLGIGSWRDAMNIAVEPADAPCGASWDATPIAEGDIAVVG